MTDLIITNGDSAGYSLRDAGKEGVILPWRDVLHEGPIVDGPIEACSAERVAYLAQRFRIPRDEIAAEFAERDAIMRRHGEFDRIELWFEHDLYDQLQLIQILAFLADANRSKDVVLVQADDYLGPQPADTILRFEDKARDVTAADLSLAAGVWRDITMPTPEATVARVASIDDGLPFLKPALVRFLEELPSPTNGLGRTEMEIIAGIKGGTASPPQLFRDAIEQEEAAFMGDTSFYGLIDDLSFCSVPLISGIAPPDKHEADAERIQSANLELTLAGEQVADSEDDHVAINGLDRWWGGTRLLGNQVWRFDRDAGKLVAPGAEEG